MRARLLLVIAFVSAAHAEPALVSGAQGLELQGSCLELKSEVARLAAYKKQSDGSVTPPSITGQGSKCRAAVRDLIPAAMAKLDGKHWLDGVGGFGNCHGEASYFLGYSPLLAHDDSGWVESLARRSTYEFPGGVEACQEVEHRDVRGGDYAVILNPSEDGRNLHSFTMLSPNVAFSKNGHNGLKIPYKVRSLTEIADEYFTFNDEGQASGKINYYREGLKSGMDCVRGSTEKDKADCVDQDYPIARFFRCKTLAELESLHKAALSKEYFELRDAVWAAARRLSVDRKLVLSPEGFPDAAFDAALKRIRDTNEKMEENGADPVALFFWAELNATASTLDRFMRSDSEVRKVLFP